LTLAVALMGTLALTLPGIASAAKGLWVSSSTPVGADISCSSPGYSTVQAGINAASPGEQVNVCAGTYTEQVEIVKPVKLTQAQGGVTLQMPSKPALSKTGCDTETGVEPGQIDEISVCTKGDVTISGLKIVALAPIETCAGGLNGVFVAGGANLTASGDQIIGASTTLKDFKGCQHGIALEVGNHHAGEVGHAKLESDAISGYEKNGPTATSPGSTLLVKGSVITGEGPSSYIAQNGIEVAFGAKGSISDTTISGNECELEGVCSSTDLEEQATGLLFFGAAAGSKVSNSTSSGNDIGVYYASTSPTQPTRPELKVLSSQLTSNRYEGAVLEEGDAALTRDTISGAGEVGIDVVQSASQSYADDSTASGCMIEEMTVAAVAITTDHLSGDPSGIFTIKGSSISKNAAQVLDPSTNFTVTRKGDS
jgi:Right handed beta helix region